MTSRPAVRGLLRSRRVWLQANSIIDSIAKPLFAAQVAFRSLDRNVAQQKLDLLQFAIRLMAETGACAPEVVRGQGRNFAVYCLLLHDAPDDFRAESGSPYPASFVDRTKESASRNTGGHGLRINSSFHPIRNRNSPYVTTFANKIGNDPVFLPLLDVLNSQCSQFRPT